MKQLHLGKAAITLSVFACAATLSFNWSEQKGPSLSVESAQARVGRPATPISGAGVARRQARRGAYGAGAVAAGAVGAGVAAAGTVAAASYYGATGPYAPYGATAPYYAPGTGPYAAYTGPVPGSAPGPTPTAYYGSYGYGYYGPERWDKSYATMNGIICQPGTLVKLDDGLMHNCQ